MKASVLIFSDGAVRQSVMPILPRRATDRVRCTVRIAHLGSGAKFTAQVLLLQALDQDAGSLALDAKRIGGPLLFGCSLGCGQRSASARCWTARRPWRRANSALLSSVPCSSLLAPAVRPGLRSGLRVADGRLRHSRRGLSTARRELR
jgi:hypothetical protein